ncbi:hypothetical protein [Ahrensia sp. R2A130]|uniref:hypothetical protein n=1 Tax=Ahrensia sp. R2A130 TaxID=744979 RepID=UPI0001E09C31|nr:hypothetical protein [Ahrensia sp. R2A130]EFL89603.1 conserved hypothetical protein [Ahrensia sp. R2A130]
MQELANIIAAKVGIDPALAEKAVGMMLGLMQRTADDGPVAEMIKAIPGGPEMVAQFGGAEAAGDAAASGGGGLMGSIMGAVSSMTGGGDTGGVMAMGQQLMAEGLEMGQIKDIATETLSYAEQHAGAETVQKVKDSIPGLGAFL